MKDNGLIEYYDLRLKTKLKKAFNDGVKKVLELRYLYLIFGIAIMVISAVYQYKVNDLKSRLESQIARYNIVEQNYEILQDAFKAEVEKREVDVRIVNEKVNNLHKFLKMMYPGYDYQSKINEALYENKLDDLPEDLWAIYVYNKHIEPHGFKKYEKALPNTVFPIEESSGYVSVKAGEFGYYRPYNKKYGYKHLGLDIKSFSSNSVLAIHDMEIWKKYYTEASGWIIEGKFTYINEENEKEYYFARYMHLEDVNYYVSKGQEVKAGQVIATMSSTGYLSTGQHIHLELWKYENKRWKPYNFVKNSTYNNRVYRSL